MNNGALSKTRTQQIVWTMLFLMPIIGMCIDLVAPSLPAIAANLHISAEVSKNLISIYLLGFALGNFFTGFLADAYGRQRLIRLSLFAFMIASVLPALFPHIAMLLIARFLQGYTIGAVSVLLRAVCADVLEPDQLTRTGPWFGTMWGLGPVFGPILGGYLQTYYGWQAGFYFFAFIAFIALAVVYFILPETHQHQHPLKITTIKKNMVIILKNPQFIGIITMIGLSYSLIVIFNVSGPFLIQSEFHHSPLFFGHVALWLGVVYLLTSLLARYLVHRFELSKLWLITIHVTFCVGILLLIISYYFSKSVIATSIMSAFMFLVCGLLVPMSIGKGLSIFRDMAGTATAVMYLVNISITGLMSYLVGFIHVVDLVHLMWIYMFLLSSIVVVYWLLLRR